MKKGTLLIGLGLALIISGIGLTGYNLIDNVRAGSTSNQASDQLKTIITPAMNKEKKEIPDYVLYPEMEMPVETVGNEQYVGMINFTTLNKELPVISQWSYPSLRIAPCRYYGSAYTDDLIICAHNFPSHFGKIKNLNYGDWISFTDMDGNVFNYTVVEILTLSYSDWYVLYDGIWDLSIFTCTISGGSRVVVRCERIR